MSTEMTQLFSSSHGSATLPVEKKRTFSGIPLSNNSQVNGGNNQVSQKIKNFFRINGLGDSKKEEKEHNEKHSKSHAGGEGLGAPKSEKEQKSSTFRQSRFLPHMGRNRSTTVASEGNPLDEGLSPTANANPYFVHQGPPALRHHNEGSVPPSPPETPRINSTKVEAVSGANDQATTAGKEELARKLRRVASAPNAQGLFAKAKSAVTNERPSTAELGKEPLVQDAASSTVSLVDPPSGGHLLPVPGENGVAPGMTPGQIRQAVAPVAFRRTYSSNSIKVRNVEVGP
ncbi:MAG: hypothetical protein INR71_11550, partial [Terriglobus roseus]|nr:hypothetical protein [Terriglobus roseus]